MIVLRIFWNGFPKDKRKHTSSKGQHLPKVADLIGEGILISWCGHQVYGERLAMD
jgi:hypothetical protein